MKIEITGDHPEQKPRVCGYCGQTHFEMCPKLYKDFNLEKVNPWKNTFIVGFSSLPLFPPHKPKA